MARGRWKAVVSLLLAAVQLAAALPAGQALDITAFSGGQAHADGILPAGGYATVANLSVPLSSVVLGGALAVSTLAGAGAPRNPAIDVGADGTAEWRFEGTGYGAFGEQSLFSNGAASADYPFTAPGNVTARLFLPGNATVQSAGFDIEGFSGQRWWNGSWRDRVPLTVRELAGKDQADFTVETILDTRNWTLASAEREFRVTRVNATTLDETEVPLQVEDEISNGSQCFEAALIFAVQNLSAGALQKYFLYFNNPDSPGRSALFWDFNPRLIRNRLTTQTGESSFFGPIGNPAGSSFDKWGNLWVADPMRHCVYSYTMTLGVVNEAGNDSKHFKNPYDVVVTPNGRIVVADTGNIRVQVFEPDGALAFTLGVTGQWGADNSHFDMPYGLGTDEDGFIYVADRGNHRIQIFDANGTYLTTIGSGQGSGNYQFSYPSGLYTGPSKDIYVADLNNQRVQTYRYTSATNWSYNFTIGVTGATGSDNAHLHYPVSVTADASGKVYIGDSENHRILIYAGNNYSGVIGLATVSGADNSHLNLPYGVSISPSNQIFISDMMLAGNGRIQVYDPSLEYVQTLGSRNWTDLMAPGATNSEFHNCTGVTADASGRIYVSDSNNHRVQIFSALGEYCMTLGVTGVPTAAHLTCSLAHPTTGSSSSRTSTTPLRTGRSG
jgi:sugar lactone lactonase YvrE